jgi:hypothetical protein
MWLSEVELCFGILRVAPFLGHGGQHNEQSRDHGKSAS